jgi:hypothetical protein
MSYTEEDWVDEDATPIAEQMTEKYQAFEYGFPLLPKNQGHNGSDLEPEQVGRVSLVRAAPSEIHCRVPL